MLTDPKLKSQVDRLWDMLWTGGLTNPMDAIEQLSFLLFMKRWMIGEPAGGAGAAARGGLCGAAGSGAALGHVDEVPGG